VKISQNVLGGYSLLTLYIPKCSALYLEQEWRYTKK